ncbi:hypothetical protein BKA70DRAFT_1423646 [Coprinopsis sp. MPI-PUGE-AT-0042]|nr:hypothetical protein BKA70DRAFT_1423646 [Coprinopsis sp. MPI-PUGE-AT-0042]
MPTTTRTIPQEVIDSVRAGDVEAMHRLAELLTPDNFTLTCLDAALVHLGLELFPADLTSLRPGLVERAHNAMFILYSANENCQRSEALKNATVRRIYEAIDGILAWTYIIVVRSSAKALDKRRPYHLMAALLKNLWTLDPMLERAIFSSRRSLDTLLGMWHTEPRDFVKGHSEFMAMGVLELMERFTSHVDGMDLLRDALCNTPSLRELLHQGLDASSHILKRFVEGEEHSGREEAFGNSRDY